MVTLSLTSAGENSTRVEKETWDISLQYATSSRFVKYTSEQEQIGSSKRFLRCTLLQRTQINCNTAHLPFILFLTTQFWHTHFVCLLYSEPNSCTHLLLKMQRITSKQIGQFFILLLTPLILCTLRKTALFFTTSVVQVICWYWHLLPNYIFTCFGVIQISLSCLGVISSALSSARKIKYRHFSYSCSEHEHENLPFSSLGLLVIPL